MSFEDDSPQTIAALYVEVKLYLKLNNHSDNIIDRCDFKDCRFSILPSAIPGYEFF